MKGWVAKNLSTILIVLAIIVLYLALLTMVEPAILWYLVGVGGLTAVLLLVQAYRKRSDILMFVSGRAAGYGANIVVFVLAGLGILVMVNLLSYGHHKRFDLTAGRQYTLSPQTMKVLEGLKREVKATVFVRENDPAFEKLRNVLEEYRYHTDKLDITFVDPDKQPRLTQEFRDRFGAFDHGTVFLESGSRTAQFKGIGERDFLTGTPVVATEEEITNAIFKVLQDRKRVIGFVIGHGERSLDGKGPEGYQVAKEALERINCEVREVNLTESPEVPEDVNALVIAGPRAAFLPYEKKALAQYAERGGRMLIMVDPFQKPGLDDLLARWGVVMDDDLIVTDDELLRLMGSDPFVAAGVPSAGHVITRDFTNVFTYHPLARSVRLEDPLPAGVHGDVIVESVPRSWAETDYKSESLVFDPAKDRNGPIPMAVALTVAPAAGRAGETAAEPPGETSAGAPGDKEAGSPGDKEAGPADDPAAGSPEDSSKAFAGEAGAGGGGPEGDGPEADNQAGSPKSARIVVFGDADFASNGGYHSAGDMNGNLFLNIVNWLTEEGDLIAIPPKAKTARMLQLTGRQADFAFLLSFFLLPVAVLIGGVVVWRRRKKL